MKIIETEIKGLFIIIHKKLEDDRGFFTRTYCKNMFSEISFEKEFVQFNHSFNIQKGTVRGMHYQKPPFSETKLIRCVQGSIFDVAVDIRQNSPTFLQYFGVILSEKNMTSILIPEGFAHGFQALENNSSLIYHHTAFYKPEADAGIRHDDSQININWQLPVINLSKKDMSYPLLNTNFKGI